MESTTATYRIMLGNLSRLEKLVEKLNKKAIKLGVPTISLTQGKIELVPNDDGTVDEFIEITLNGEVVKLNGWQFVATLQHTQDDEGNSLNVLRTMPTFESMLPDEFRHSDPSRCDQCHTARYRIDTYVVFNEGTKEWAQLGSTCLKDFLGHKDPHAFAQAAEMYLMLCEAASEYCDYIGGGRATKMELVYGLGWAAEAMLRNGWLSRTKARDIGGLATADIAMHAMELENRRLNTCNRNCYKQPCPEHIKPTEEAWKLVDLVREWAPDFLEKELAKNESDYIWNLKVVLGSEFIDLRSYGLAASILGAYQREMARKARAEEAAKNSVSEWQGTINEKLENVRLQVKAFRYCSSDFGVTTLITYHDAQGNVYKWFSSGETVPTIDEWGTYKFTVKRHSEFNGVKETMINRVSPYLNPKEVKARKLAQKEAKALYMEQKTLAEQAWAAMEEIGYNDPQRLVLAEAYRTAADRANEFHKAWKDL